MEEPDQPAESYSVTFELPDGERVSVEAGAEEHILDAARRAGLDLPSRCEQGWDLVCAARVLRGRFDQSDSRRYYEEDRAGGFALICTARARSDLCMWTHQSQAMRDARRAKGLPAPESV